MSTPQIRLANQEDLPGMVKVRVDTWRSAYRGLVPDAYLDALSYERIVERWREWLFLNPPPKIAAFVAEEDQAGIVGIAICGPEEGSDPIYAGQVFVLYVHPVYQRQGSGRRLMGACAAHLAKEGMGSLLVWVLRDNPYRAFYENLGGSRLREKKVRIGDLDLPEVAYGWKDVRQESWFTLG